MRLFVFFDSIIVMPKFKIFTGKLSFEFSFECFFLLSKFNLGNYTSVERHHKKRKDHFIHCLEVIQVLLKVIMPLLVLAQRANNGPAVLIGFHFLSLPNGRS